MNSPRITPADHSLDDQINALLFGDAKKREETVAELAKNDRRNATLLLISAFEKEKDDFIKAAILMALAKHKNDDAKTAMQCLAKKIKENEVPTIRRLAERLLTKEVN